MKGKVKLGVLALLGFLLLLPGVLGASVSISQSGADAGTVMLSKTFTVTVSGASANAQVTITLPTGISLSGESSTKTTNNNGIVSWTTVIANQLLSAQTISVSISGQGSPETVTSSSFNVITPPSLSVSVSTASVTVDQGSSFAVSLSMQNSGQTTARFGTITVSDSGLSISSGCSPSDIGGGQSAAVSCTISASSSGTKTMSVVVAPSNADAIAKTVSVTVNALAGGGGQDGSGGGGGGAAGAKNKTKHHTLVPGIGLRNNTKLQAAIEKVLAKGQMSDTARENLIRLSQSIVSDINATREVKAETSSSTLTLKIKYKGAKKVKNFIVWDSLPKAFANSTVNITVNAPGAYVEIVEEDPEYIFIYPEISPNQEMTITYTTGRSVPTSVVDSSDLEIYAESLEEVQPQGAVCGNGLCEAGEDYITCLQDCPTEAGICTPGQRRCTGDNLMECNSAGDTWLTIQTCEFGCSNEACNSSPQPQDYTGIIVFIAVVAILAVLAGVYKGYYVKKKPKSLRL